MKRPTRATYAVAAILALSIPVRLQSKVTFTHKPAAEVTPRAVN